MGHGDRYDLRTRTLTPARARFDGQVIDPRAATFKPYHQDVPFTLGDLAAGADAYTLANAGLDVVTVRAAQPPYILNTGCPVSLSPVNLSAQCLGNAFAMLLEAQIHRRHDATRVCDVVHHEPAGQGVAATPVAGPA